MNGRLLVALSVVLAASPAAAHRLEVDVVRTGRTVTVEAFYPGDGSAAAGARVRIEGSGGRVLAEGEADNDGVFVFETDATGALTVTADHGGHRGETSVAATAPGSRASETGDPAAGRTSARRREPTPVIEIVAGLALIFAVAGFIIALAAWRRVAALAERLEQKQAGARDAP